MLISGKSCNCLLDSYKIINMDVDYSIEDCKVLEAYQNAVIIEVEQKLIFNKVAEGMQATDSMTTAVHTLVKEEGTYKFYETEVTNTEPI